MSSALSFGANGRVPPTPPWTERLLAPHVRATDVAPCVLGDAAPADLVVRATLFADHYRDDTLQLNLARETLEHALEQANREENYLAVSQLAYALACLAGRTPTLAAAERWLRLGMVACRETGNRRLRLLLTNRLGLLCFMHGRYALGWRLWRPGLAWDQDNSLALWDPIGSFAPLCDLMGGFGALDLFLAAAERACASDDPGGRDALTVALFIRGFQRRHVRVAGAEEDLATCLNLLAWHAPHSPKHQLLSLVAQCELARLRGDDAYVRASLEAAAGLAMLYADPYTLVAILADQGMFALGQGDMAGTRATYERLRALTYEALPLWRRCVVFLESRLAPSGQVVTTSRAHASPLTEREGEVLRVIASGHSNRQAAILLGVSPTTVKKHLEHIYAKLGVSCRLAAVAAARTLDLLD